MPLFASAKDDLEVSEEIPTDRGRPEKAGGAAGGASAEELDGVATNKKTRNVDRATEERERERHNSRGTSKLPKVKPHMQPPLDDDRYTIVARHIRLAVSPYLPPPVVDGVARHTDPFLRPYAGEEGTTKVVLSLVAAYVAMRAVQFVLSRSLWGKGRAVQGLDDENEDPALAASHRASAEYDRTVVICGPSSSGKTRLLYHLCYDETVDTVASIKVNVVISDRTRYMDWPGTAKLNSDAFRSVLRQGRPFVVVLVVDATQPVAGAADCLHQLFSICHASSSLTSAGPMTVLVLCHKSDLPTAKNPKRVQLQLRGELERLLKSSAARGASGSSASESTSPNARSQWWPVGEPVDFEALKFAKLLFRSTSCEGKGCRELVNEFARTGSLVD